eukprot:SAG31_NODE_36824_length_310_cov_0.488152_2_plen_43_part_01
MDDLVCTYDAPGVVGPEWRHAVKFTVHANGRLPRDPPVTPTQV